MDDQVLRKTIGLRSSCVEDLNVDSEVLGVSVRRQLSKTIIVKVSLWAKVLFHFQDMMINSGEWSDPKVMIATFKRKNGIYIRQTYHIISTKSEAEKLVSELTECFKLGADHG